jgi:hypothetical protein
MSVKIGIGSKHEARAVIFNSKLTPYGQLDLKGREIVAELEKEFLEVEEEARRAGAERLKMHLDQFVRMLHKRINLIPKSIFKLAINRSRCFFREHLFAVDGLICIRCATPSPNPPRLNYPENKKDAPPPPPPESDSCVRVYS